MGEKKGVHLYYSTCNCRHNIISHALGVKKHVITYCAFIANGQVRNLINMAISEFFYRFLHGTNLLSESVQIIFNCTSFSLKFASMVLYGLQLRPH